MTTRWIHPPRLVRPNDHDGFDAAIEGARYRLAGDRLLAIWELACAEATDRAGWRDPALAAQRFHELAAQIAARGGRRVPEVGRLTRVDTELGGGSLDAWWLGERARRIPGRDTLAAAETRRQTQDHAQTTATAATEAPPSAERPTPRRDAPPPPLDLRAWVPRPRPPAHARPRRLAELDRTAQVREAARLYRTGELAAALERNEPGLVDAVAAALHDGAILAPHPVDQWRDSTRGLAAELAVAGIGAGRAARRWLGGTPWASAGHRVFEAVDARTGGAARVWSERARGWVDGAARRAMASRDRAAVAEAPAQLSQLSGAGGTPLSAALRARLEALFGHRFGHVRIHTDGAATEAAEAAGARAITLGSHIYFHRGQFAPGSEAGDRLLLHELMHVVQHDEGRLPAPASGEVELSSPSDPAEQEARTVEARAGELRASDARRGEAAPQIAPPAPTPAADAPRTGKRASPGLFGWVDDKLHDIGNWAEDKIEGLVLKVAPGLGTLIHEGPGGLIKQAIEPAISSWVGTVTGGVNVGKVAGDLKTSFSSAFAVLQGAKAGDPKCCDTLVSGINAIREIAHVFTDNPVMDAIKGILTKVSSIVETIAKVVIGPVFDALKSIVGGAWDAIKGVASTIQKWFDAVKNIASKAFDWVAKKLGFPSGSGEGGLLDWLKQKAIAIWEEIKQTLKPVIGPLKVIGGVLVMLTPLPEIYAIIKYGPQIVEAVQWLWANRNNPNAAKQNPKLLGGSILPKILGAGQGFVATVKHGVSWLAEKITAFAGGTLQLLGAITGVPLLDMAHGFVQTLSEGAKGIQDWAVGAFTSAAGWLDSTFHKVADFIKPYADVLCSVAMAVVNPSSIPMILAGWAWQWLPDCIKPPLIDLLLDAVISVLEGLPSLPMLGPLWPLLKSGVLGFLHAVRARDPETKVKISNKLAKIISGASPAFLLGFVKGLLSGVWDGIKMPFQAIWLIVEGLGKAGDFFVALGRETDDKSSHLPAATAHAAGPPKTGPRPSAPLPAIPGAIQPDQASAVVGRIAAQLNAQKPPPGPPRPAPAAAAGSAASNRPYQALGQTAKAMAGKLSGPTKTVTTEFGPAVKQLFSSGKGTSINGVMAKLHTVWEAAKAAVSKEAAKIANMICDFFLKDSAEEQLGETIGYLVGTIAFQALLDALTVGAWSEVSAVLTGIAKFLNWPMEFLGEAMRLLKSLGGYLLDGLKQLGGMVEHAGAGALREVTGALRDIASKLGEFADEIMGKFGKDAGAADGAAAHDAASTAEHDATGTAGHDADAARDGDRGYQSAAEREAEKAEEFEEALAVSKAIARAEDVGRVPGPAIAASLEALKARYRWIKAYTAEPRGARFELVLIASSTEFFETHEEGGEPPVPGTPPKVPVETTGPNWGIPEGGVPIEPRMGQKGITVPDYAKQDPGHYYYDPKTGKYNRRIGFPADLGADHTIPCFPAGTLVATPDGPCEIERIAVGQSVLAYQEATRKAVSRRVLALHVSSTDWLYRIRTGEAAVCATGEHLFWIGPGEYRAARELAPGVALLSADGDRREIASIEPIHAGRQPTYNLSVETDFTYYVGPDRLLVHNDGAFAIYIGKIFAENGGEVVEETVYVGLTSQGLAKREGQHHGDAKAAPEKYAGKEDLQLEYARGPDGKLLTNLSEDEAKYWERKIYDRELSAGAKLANRQIPYTDESMQDLIKKYCSK
jgi:hypothetical protein